MDTQISAVDLKTQFQVHIFSGLTHSFIFSVHISAPKSKNGAKLKSHASRKTNEMYFLTLKDLVPLECNGPFKPFVFLEKNSQCKDEVTRKNENVKNMFDSPSHLLDILSSSFEDGKLNPKRNLISRPLFWLRARISHSKVHVFNSFASY